MPVARTSVDQLYILRLLLRVLYGQLMDVWSCVYGLVDVAGWVMAAAYRYLYPSVVAPVGRYHLLAVTTSHPIFRQVGVALAERFRYR